ncbi:MAG TPA: hypothetical protein VGM81_05370 [Burkholderiaceae bacterium]|jgi:hypothetical protein
MRTLLLIFALANVLFFSWSRGWLDGVTGIPADGEHEPLRVAQQLHPERVQLLGRDAVAALQKTACVELSPAPDNAQTLLTKAGVPPSSYTQRMDAVPGVWAVATIKLVNKEFQTRKEETYKRMHVNFEYLEGHPDETPTMVLSRHPSEKAAEAALNALDLRGLKGLRVLPLQPAGQRASFVFARADGLLQAKLRNLRDPAVAAGLHECLAGSASAATAATTAPAGAAAASSPASGPAAKAG